MDQIKPLSDAGDILLKRSLTDGVYDYLYKRIIAGKYSPGDWLRQEDISTQLGVSQTPVREALDRLVAAGLAERVPFRGVRVPKLESKEIIDAFIMRLVLESVAARLTAQSISADQIKKLSNIVERTKDLLSLEDMSTLRQLNKEFHKELVDSSGNALLSKLYEMVTNSFPDWMLYEYLFRHPELLQSSLQREYVEHKAIVDALMENDPQKTAEQVTLHIRNLREELETYLDIPGDFILKIESQIEPMLYIHKK